MLEQVDLSLSLSKRAFKQISRFQVERLYELTHLNYENQVPVIILFEGWDAAGKGTAIRALTERLDPRGFKVMPTQAPRTHEQQKPWLWRFWMQIPRRGQMAIFDRSWYGRVLIERVNGLTPIPDWIRAYEEINAFERTLADDKTIFVKFWMHISRDEQLRRYIAMTQDPDTAWQVTAEDWENHRRYHEYEAAVEDMLASTNMPYAPWTIVPSTDMNYKTYLVFRTLIEQLEEALGVEPTAWQELDILEAEAKKKHKAKKKKKAKRKAEEKTKAKAKEVELEKEMAMAGAEEAGEEEVGKENDADATPEDASQGAAEDEAVNPTVESEVEPAAGTSAPNAGEPTDENTEEDEEALPNA